MRLYKCRNCTALFEQPKGHSCPACGDTGPTAFDVESDTNSYENNWYTPIRVEV